MIKELQRIAKVMAYFACILFLAPIWVPVVIVLTTSQMMKETNRDGE